MTSQQAREKLGRIVLGAPRSEWKQGVVDIMAAADVAMLAVHVEACEVAGRTAHGNRWRRRAIGWRAGDPWPRHGEADYGVGCRFKSQAEICGP